MYKEGVAKEVPTSGILGFTPLHVAAACGLKEEVESLLERSGDFDVDARTDDLFTPLHLAAMNYPKEVAELLVKHGADVNARSVDLRTPLHIAVDEERYEVAKFLVVNGARVNAACQHSLTPLHLAARMCDEYLVELLLKAGASVNAQAERLVTPLHLAVYNGSLEMSLLQKEEPPVIRKVRVAKLLLSHGAHVNARTEKSEKSVRSASCVPHSLKALRLFPYGMGTHERIARFLIKSGADVNAGDFFGETPLHIAVREGLDSLVAVLLEYRADLDSVDGCGHTALDKSVQFGRYNVSELLLKKGAKTNTQAHGQVTSLHVASRAGDRNHVALLLQYEADADAVCEDGTALHIASRSSNLSIMNLLLDHDVDVNAQSEQGTPLHIAASNGHKDAVKLLLFYGADLNFKNKHKLTPLECAANNACYNPLAPGVLVYLMATFKVLLEQVVRMKYVGAYVVDANLKFLTSESEFMTRFETFFNWSYRLRKLVSDCEAEIVVMRADKMPDSNLTYYDIANRDGRRVIRLLSNPSIEEILSKGLYCDQYLTYSNIIKSKFEVAMKRKKFEEGSRKVFFRVYFDRLPDICIERIMDYLTDRELKLLMYLSGHSRKM